MNKETLDIAKLLKKHNCEYLILFSHDQFFNEYSPDHLNRLKFITGFTGSFGIAIISKTKSFFLTDGRYIEQASTELDLNKYTIYNIKEVSLTQLIENKIGKSHKILLDSNVISYEHFFKLSKAFHKVFKTTSSMFKLNLEMKNKFRIFDYPLPYCGANRESKIVDILSSIIGSNAHGLFITNNENISWLLNIRSDENWLTPSVNCFCFINHSGNITLFVNKLSNYNISTGLKKLFDWQDNKELKNFIQTHFANNVILVDNNNLNLANYKLLKKFKVRINFCSDQILFKRAIKSDNELQYNLECHIQDAKSLIKFNFFLENLYQENKNEYELSILLSEIRSQQKLYISDSFHNIIGFKENGSIIHYRPTNEKSKMVQGDGIMLVDSGGQYLGGTTDVTRVFNFGSPTSKEIFHYTLVLKSHISLAASVFPAGTTGFQLDILARNLLWKHGLDFDHGTGHGVGNFLNVHEGPHRISSKFNNVALEPGMISSIEPGVYIQNSHGIRIENLYYVKKHSKRFLCFEPLTLVPFNHHLIDSKLLIQDEINWIKNYYLKINSLIKFEENDIQEWLTSILNKY